jgi:hypothetical protein
VLGIASLELGNRARASQCLRASLELCEELGFGVGAAYAVGALGATAIRRNQHREGIKLIAAAEAFLAEEGVNMETVERELTQSAIEDARAALGSDEFSAAWIEGSKTALPVAGQEARTP